MRKLELIKGLSYSMKRFSAIKGEPFSVEDEKADQLMKTGRFKEIVDEVKEDVVNQEEAPDNAENSPHDEKPIEKMKKEELVEYAEKNGIDISACKNNEERIATIKAAMSDDEEAKVGFEE